MNPYRVAYTSYVLRELRKLPREVQPRVYAAIKRLSVDPRPPKSATLQGDETLWRVRIGDYRVVYEIDDASRVVKITRARHRSDVYRA